MIWTSKGGGKAPKLNKPKSKTLRKTKDNRNLSQVVNDVSLRVAY